MNSRVTSSIAIVFLALVTVTGVTQAKKPESATEVDARVLFAGFHDQANAALNAVHSGDCEIAMTTGKSLEKAWDSDVGELKKKMPLSYQEIDGLMDGFLDSITNECRDQTHKQNDTASVDAAYEKYVTALKRSEDPSYGANVGGDVTVPLEKTSSGLNYIITKHGAGPLPKVGEIVFVKATGLLPNGVAYFHAKTEGTPVIAELAQDRMIPGLFEGIGLLHRGDSAILLIPPALAYGAHSAAKGIVPPNSMLIYFLELVDIKALTAGQMLQHAIDKKGVDFALEEFNREKKLGFPDVYVSEASINSLGYSLLAKGDRNAAIEILKLNAGEYPQSANVYDSLGEAYAANGEKQIAIENYRKALAIDPKFTSSSEALKRLLSE